MTHVAQQTENAPERTAATRARRYRPHTDVHETKEAIVLLIDVPGVEPGGMDVHLEDGVIEVLGRTGEPELGERRPLVGEYEPREYRRSFLLPDHVDAAKIDAGLKNGVLTITLPKVESAQPRRIPVGPGG